MSLHPSLKIDIAGVQQRSVLTRIERIKDLMKKGLWNEERSVTALPKTKIVRLKTAKTKTKDEEVKTAEATAAAPGTEAKEAKGKVETKAKAKE